MKITGLEWDEYNIAYIARHKVNPQEFEEVCYGRHFAKKDPASKSKGKVRYILAGQTNSGRYLDVIIEKLYGTYYRPVNGFDMSDNYASNYRRRLSKRGYR